MEDTLSDISQSPKDRYCVTPHLRVVKIETGRRMAGARGWGSREGGVIVSGHRVSVLHDEKSSGEKMIKVVNFVMCILQ